MQAAFSVIADILGIAAAVFAFGAYIQTRLLRSEREAEKERQSQLIRVKLANGNRQIQLPIPMRRADFSRAEVQGRLGNIPLKGGAGRYKLSHLSTIDFIQAIDRIAKGEDPDNVLIIPCDDAEMDQFDLTNF